MSRDDNGMSPEERVDWDRVRYDGTHFPDGTRRPSAQIGPRILTALREEARRRRPWVRLKLERATSDGLRRVGLDYANQLEQISAKVDGVTITKAAARGVYRRTEGDEPVAYVQQVLWEDQTDAELVQVQTLALNGVQRHSENFAIAERLRRLLKDEQVGEDGSVQEALDRRGLTLEEYLAEEPKSGTDD